MEELRATAAGDPDVAIINEERWKLPAVLYDVSFDRVKRLKMDILMKMLLLTFQEADIRRAATLSDMLFVEELFISDLIGKMQRTGLIGLEKQGYRLTAKGYDYLGKGIFEERWKEVKRSSPTAPSMTTTGWRQMTCFQRQKIRFRFTAIPSKAV